MHVPLFADVAYTVQHDSAIRDAVFCRPRAHGGFVRCVSALVAAMLRDTVDFLTLSQTVSQPPLAVHCSPLTLSFWRERVV